MPQSILYDNTKIAVARILGDGKRQRTRVFSELQSHYLFEDRFGRPGKGNDKGKVEGLVGYARRNFLVPIPVFDELRGIERASSGVLPQAAWRSAARPRRDDRRAAGSAISPPSRRRCRRPTTPARRGRARVTSLSLVRYRRNDYSVPTAYGHREVLVRGYVHEVVIACGAEVIARHPRSYEREDFVFDPLHYLALIEQKINALDQAAPLADWKLPEEFATLRRLLEARMGKKGKREFVQVLRLMEVFRIDDVAAGVRDAIARGAIGFDAVKHLVLCRIERRPPRLDMTVYPYLPKATVATTSARVVHGSSGRGRRHDRHAADPARPSPEGAEAADVPARVRQGRPPVRRRGRRPSALSAAAGRAGDDRARAAHGRAPDQGGQVPDRQEPRQLRLPGAAVARTRRWCWSWRARSTSSAARTSSRVGNSGTGKSHIALGLGLAACQKGLSVGFITAAALVHELIEARDEKRLLRLQRQLAAYKLLIIDELGYVPLSQTGAELLFEVFSQRYERGTTIVTSNLPFDEWTSCSVPSG